MSYCLVFLSIMEAYKGGIYIDNMVDSRTRYMLLMGQSMIAHTYNNIEKHTA